MSTAIILTGKHEVTEQRYQPVADEFRTHGWNKVIIYEPDWSTANVKQLVDDFIAFLPDKRDHLTLLGFSLGAMIALIAASKVSVENLILCSPSGYFAEYDTLLGKDDKIWANNNLADFRNFSATTTVNNTTAHNGFIIAGQKELSDWPDFKQWVEDLRKLTRWRYTELAGTGHEIEARKYQDSIKNIIHSASP